MKLKTSKHRMNSFYRAACGHMLFLLLVLSIGMTSFAQDVFPAALQQQVEQYRSKAIQEKVFVHTDKTFYLTGEIVWFKLYDVDGYFNRPFDISKVGYIEIIDNNHKSLLQAKIDLNGGSGSGSFLLPTSIQSGNYMLRAYTNWMKNFNPAYFFEQPIAIVNAMKKPVWQAISDKPVSYDVQFFPEGGNLVEGIKSKVAFRAVDQYGKGIDCSGTLLNQKNETVASFNSLRFGMGQFEFTPVSGDTYSASIRPATGNAITQKLPAIYKEGYVVHLSNANNDEIKITVNTNIAAANNLPVYLFVHTRQLVKSVQAKEFKDGEAVFTVDKKQLGDGISQLTVFNNARQPVCERLYFKRPQEKLIMDVTTDMTEYTTRKKVNVGITTHNTSGKLEEAGMSMSVFLVDSLQSQKQNDILSYLWLSADLRGNIESPSYYLNNTGQDVDEATENLLLTQGWRRFRWEDVLGTTKPAFEFLPEYEGHIINAKVIDKKTGLPAAGVACWLSVPAEKYHLSTAISNRDGQVKFIVKEFYGNDEIILQAKNKGDSVYRIDVLNPYSENFSTTQLQAFDLPEAWASQLALRSVGAQVQNTYQPNKKQQFALPAITDTTMFYGKPDKKYFLDDYTRFTTMDEVMREYIAEVHVRKRNDKLHFDVANIPYRNFFDDDPLVLLDGLPVFDVEKIMALDPLKVKKIEIVGRKYYYGPLVNSGIVSYSSYQGDLAGYELDPNSIILEYQGLQLQREFYSPVYETPAQTESRIPDFRNVLYWSPSIQTDETGKTQLSFFTSNIPGKYAILLQGITQDGLVGSRIVNFTVK